MKVNSKFRCRQILVTLFAAVVIAACGGETDSGSAVASAGDGSSGEATAADNAGSSGSGGLGSGGSALWFDHEWSFTALTDVTPEDAAGTQRVVETTLTLRNPLTDQGYGLPTDWVSIRTADGDRFESSRAENLADGAGDSFFEVDPESRGEWRIEFEVPGSEDISTLSIEIGAAPNRTVTVGPNGVTDLSTTAPVSLTTTSWDGEYSWNSATITVLDAFADLSAGTYPDGSARPEPFLEDRQADAGQVFVHIDFELTERSTSSVIGVAVNTHRIIADGEAFECTEDGTAGTISAETVRYSATCPIPVDATSLLLEIGTDPCVGGCSEWEWTSQIDTGFLAAFDQ